MENLLEEEFFLNEMIQVFDSYGNKNSFPPTERIIFETAKEVY